MSLLRENNISAADGSVHQATTIQLIWLIFTILAFAYDIPIYNVTSFERANPRLVDISTLLGVIFILPNLRKTHLPLVFKVWKLMVFWCVFCALFWSIFWLPWQDVGVFSIFYALRYLQGLLLIYIACKIPISAEQKRVLINCVIAGGVFVAIYAIPEYIRGDTERYLADGKVVYYAPGTLFSSLGTSYHHLAGFSSLAFAMTLSSISLVRGKIKRFLLLGLSIFVAWPALFSGARSGLLAVGLIVLLAFFESKVIRNYLILILLILLPIWITSNALNVSDLESKSATLQRLINMDDINQDNNISGRLTINNYSIDLYEWQGARLLFLGGGFYVVPHLISGNLNYRIGYGIHNSYLFPLEQGGVVLFVLFFVLLYLIYKRLIKIKKSSNRVDNVFASAIWMFFVTQIFAGFFGGNGIWQSTGMENFSTYVLLMYVLAGRETQINRLKFK